MDRTDDDDVDLKRISVFKFLSLITCLQYRPRALQHYTRVSCVEIHHIARKFHKKNTRETLV